MGRKYDYVDPDYNGCRSSIAKVLRALITCCVTIDGKANRARLQAWSLLIAVRPGRSALGSYAVARFLTEHAYEDMPGLRCAVCGQYRSAGDEPEDLNVLSFERFKWGGVRTDHIEYVAFDLEQFARAPRITPAASDISLGQQLIDQLRRLPAGTTAAQAVTSLKMIKGNKAERDVIIGILGVCGILQTTDHPGYSQSFVRYRDRELPPRRFTDQDYPACWWTAADGVDSDALRVFLPELT
jgi:hypothetical protein